MLQGTEEVHSIHRLAELTQTLQVIFPIDLSQLLSGDIWLWSSGCLQQMVKKQSWEKRRERSKKIKETAQVGCFVCLFYPHTLKSVWSSVLLQRFCWEMAAAQGPSGVCKITWDEKWRTTSEVLYCDINDGRSGPPRPDAHFSLTQRAEGLLRASRGEWGESSSWGRLSGGSEWKWRLLPNRQTSVNM